MHQKWTLNSISTLQTVKSLLKLTFQSEKQLKFVQISDFVNVCPRWLRGVSRRSGWSRRSVESGAARWSDCYVVLNTVHIPAIRANRKNQNSVDKVISESLGSASELESSLIFRQQFHRDPRFTTKNTYKRRRFIGKSPMFSAQDF